MIQVTRKRVYAAMASAALFFCGFPVVIDLVESRRFDHCMSDRGVEDYKARQNAVTLVSLYPKDGDGYVCVDFSNPNMVTSGPYFIDQKKKRIPLARMTKQQVELVKHVDVCRRGGLIGTFYSYIGLLQPKNDG